MIRQLIAQWVGPSAVPADLLPPAAPRSRPFTHDPPLRPAVRHPWGWADSLVLGGLALLMRLPYQTTTLYHWDSVLYARALAQFDVSESQPHPPGYLFYVGLARVAQSALGDANASLVAVSLAGATLAVVLTYWLARLLYGRPAGALAALLLATAPPFWFYSGVAYPYTLLAAGSAGLALAAVHVWRGTWHHPAALGWLVGLLGGVRLDLLVFLAPLLTVAHLAGWWRDRTWRVLLAPLTGLVGGTLLWLVPTALLSGGWEVYLPLLLQQGRYVEGSYSVWARGLVALQSNGWQVLVYAWEGLQLAIVPAGLMLLAGLRRWRRGRRAWRWAEAPAGAVLALWVAPPLLFYTLVHIGDRGYSFSYLPGLCVLAAAGTVQLATNWLPRLLRRAGRWRTGVGSTGLAATLAVVLIVPNLLTFLAGHGRMSAFEVRCGNRTTAETLALIREWFPAEETLLFSSFFYQHARHYLPEYRAWWYDPLSRPVFRERLAPEIRHVVLFGEGLGAARQPNASFFALSCERRLHYFSPVEPGAQLVYRPPVLDVLPTP